jgi:predicted DNA-binding ribbon-helix-helix protein
LESEFWDSLHEIATTQHINISQLISTVVDQQKQENLSSVIRQFVLGYYTDGRDKKTKRRAG